MFKQLLKILVVMALIVGAHGAPYSEAATITLPKTGQTKCYDPTGTTIDEIACVGTGQDANTLKGAAWPVPRFIDNKLADGTTAAGTVTDNLTGLIWLKDAGCIATVGGITKGTNPGTSYLTWPNALTWSNNLKGDNSACSLNDGSVAGDWRLPSRKELQSLIDRQNFNPALPMAHPFSSNFQADYYWSSTTYVGSTGSAWGVGMGPGGVYDGSKNSKYYVWPVRGGQFGDSVSLVLPAVKDFGTVAVSGNSNQTFTISNKGATSRLHINAMVLSGTDAGLFTLNVGNGSAGTCGSKTPIIATGGNCTVSVTFTPGSIGAKSASLRISGSDVTTPNVDIALSGTGALTYTVTYDGNGKNSGIVPVDAISPYVSGANVTVLGNSGALTKTGNTFFGWNTAADGSGTSYAPAATFAIAGNTTLYAKWTAVVTYNGNGNTGGSVPSDASNYLAGNTVAVLGNSGTLVKTGYTFGGWNTAADGSGTTYAPTATFAIAGNTALYAKWTAVVTYNSNGSSSGTVPTDAGAYLSGATVIVLGNSGTLTKTGYTFAGWNTAANGSGTNYAAAATFAITGNVTLYAKWSINSYSVTFTSNGGSATASQTINYNATATVPPTPTRTGYTFADWYSDIALTSTFAFTTAITADTTLYTKWTSLSPEPQSSPDPSPTYNGGGNNAGTMSIARSCPAGSAGSTITDALKALQSISGTIQLTPEELICFDVAPLDAKGTPKGDGTIDFADILIILRRSVGIGNW